jgi:hypothetical protein
MRAYVLSRVTHHLELFGSCRSKSTDPELIDRNWFQQGLGIRLELPLGLMSFRWLVALAPFEAIPYPGLLPNSGHGALTDRPEDAIQNSLLADRHKFSTMALEIQGFL